MTLHLKPKTPFHEDSWEPRSLEEKDPRRANDPTHPLGSTDGKKKDTTTSPDVYGGTDSTSHEGIRWCGTETRTHGSIAVCAHLRAVYVSVPVTVTKEFSH